MCVRGCACTDANKNPPELHSQYGGALSVDDTAGAPWAATAGTDTLCTAAPLPKPLATSAKAAGRALPAVADPVPFPVRVAVADTRAEGTLFAAGGAVVAGKTMVILVDTLSAKAVPLPSPSGISVADWASTVMFGVPGAG